MDKSQVRELADGLGLDTQFWSMQNTNSYLWRQLACCTEKKGSIESTQNVHCFGKVISGWTVNGGQASVPSQLNGY